MERLLRWCYSAVFWLIVPFLLLHLVWKGRTNRDYRRRWRERFGYPKQLSSWLADGILLHAVSVGELNAARPVLDRLLQQYPQLPITITTTTPSASRQVTECFGEQVQHAYLPFDLPQPLNHFLGKLKPRLVLVMETEIWPNLFFQAHRHGAVLAMLNARLSRHTAARYRWLAPLVKPTLAMVDWLGAQSAADAQRLIVHGADSTAVEITGNLKFDLQPASQDWQRVRDLKQQLGKRLVWIAGSTHAGEESILLDQYQRWQAEYPELLLVLAPRHPERAERVYAECQQRDLHAVRYTHSRPVDTQAEVIILDIIGQLLSWYGAGDLAFLGGTLVPVGGHNAVEPAAMGCPVVVGPYRENIQETVARLDAVNGAVLLDSEQQLGACLAGLLADGELRQRMGQAAQELVFSQSGGLEKTLTRLARVLDH